MAEGDRLGGLQMRETGHDVCSVLERLFSQYLLQAGQLGVEQVETVADI